MYKKQVLFCILFLLFFTSIPISAQTGSTPETLYNRRIVWREDAYTFRYRVEVERQDNGSFRNFLREYTTAPFLVVSLPAGEYRFRITPYDILDRPAPGTDWVRFEVRPPVVLTVDDSGETAPDIEIEEIHVTGSNEQLTVNNEEVTENNEQIADISEQSNLRFGTESEDHDSESKVNNTRFNTVGISVGTSFIDPLIIAGIHGSYSPLPNLFVELGFEAGFLSVFDDVESFYCFYPYANLGYYMPISETVGFFAGIGGGLMMANYTFSHVKKDIGFLAMNIFAGVNLWDMFNITYTFRTTFSEVSHKVGVGYVYRFGNRK